MTTAPTNEEYISAAEAAYLNGPVQGLTPLLGPNGQPVVSPASELGDGFYAEALVDSSGNVIIAYEGTVPGTSTYDVGSLEADYDILNETTPKAFTDAAAFAATVEQDAKAKYGSSVSVTVTGHSLGASEAEYAALKTGLGGVTFAGTGIPGYSANGSTAHANLINYVAYGDPVANYSSDTPDEVGFAPSKNMDHVGTVALVGSPSSGTSLKQDSANYGRTGSYWDVFYSLFDVYEYHGLSNYASILGLTVPTTTSTTTSTSSTSSTASSASATTSSATPASSSPASTGTDTLVGTATNKTLVGSNTEANLFQLGAGGDSVTFGKGVSNTVDYSKGDGAATVTLNGGVGVLQFEGSITDQNLWFARSGTNLVVDVLGSSDHLTVTGFFNYPATTISEIKAGGLELDGQLNNLISAMASFSASNSGFNPVTSSQIPSNAALQKEIAAAWHS